MTFVKLLQFAAAGSRAGFCGGHLRLVTRLIAYAASTAGIGTAFAAWAAFAIVLGLGQFLVHD